MKPGKHDVRKLLRHPLFWLVAFFLALGALEAAFFVVAGSLPDERLAEVASQSEPPQREAR